MKWGKRKSQRFIKANKYNDGIRYSVTIDNGYDGSAKTIKGVNKLLSYGSYSRAKVHDYKTDTDTFLKNSELYRGHYRRGSLRGGGVAIGNQYHDTAAKTIRGIKQAEERGWVKEAVRHYNKPRKDW